MAGSSSPRAQADAMAAVIDWNVVGPAFHDFWTSANAREVANTGLLTGRFRSCGQLLRFVAMVASAVVTGLARFEGSLIRAAAFAGGVAVVATGSAASFHADQRVATNRRTQQLLLSERRRFVAGRAITRVGPPPRTPPSSCSVSSRSSPPTSTTTSRPSTNPPPHPDRYRFPTVRSSRSATS
ncbi:hypothetical protein ACWDUL_05260 [Nocardia niigatensis]